MNQYKFTNVAELDFELGQSEEYGKSKKVYSTSNENGTLILLHDKSKLVLKYFFYDLDGKAIVEGKDINFSDSNIEVNELTIFDLQILSNGDYLIFCQNLSDTIYLVINKDNNTTREEEKFEINSNNILIKEIIEKETLHIFYTCS